MEDQAKSGGGQIVYEEAGDDKYDMTIRFERNSVPVWAAIRRCGPGCYVVTVIEEKKLHSAVVPSQSDMQAAIDERGRVTLHINFDFDRASLRPDAQPVVRDIVAILKAKPALKLEVDGHTDGIGLDGYNQALSEERAKAVVAAIIAGGVESPRLTSAGFGASKPIADNATEQGRADNRRVELVRQ